MREYKNRQDAQKKHYYKDPFFVMPSTEKSSVDNKSFENDLQILKDNGVEIIDAYVELETLVVCVKKDENLKALRAVKDAGYELLCEISAVDFLTKGGYFCVFYQLLSISSYRRIRIKCKILQNEMLQSVTQVYKCANWLEREMYDMFGIMILNHPNLKRLLMPDDWVLYPLLKSYPLHGDEHAKWYEVDKIFGREFRDKIGEENRDQARIDSKDTFEFSRIYHEVERGARPRDERIKQEYQEDSGVAFVKKVKRNSVKIIKKRP